MICKDDVKSAFPREMMMLLQDLQKLGRVKPMVVN
jgi:hypothetical protein